MPMHLRSRKSTSPLPARWTLTDFMLANGLKPQETAIGYAADARHRLSFKSAEDTDPTLAATYLRLHGAALIGPLTALDVSYDYPVTAILGRLGHIGRTYENELTQLRAALRNLPGRHGWQVFTASGTLCLVALNQSPPASEAQAAALAAAHQIFRLYTVYVGEILLEEAG